MSETIFQDIWNADQSGNGIPALRPTEQKDAARGYVVVDERASAVGSSHRVLKEVVIPEAKMETYRLCERLFDNYALERAVREQVIPQETQEELDFIDAIFELADIQIAPGDIFKFIIPGNGGILRNKAGTIKLRTPEGVIAQNCQYTTEQGRQEGIAILF
ncbi:MAG: hypothetical protein F6K16_00485 [Symploca sp. SIO2B6]|nr:hypothetical protein [Symploca sp. SIO2B6]